MWTAQTVRAGAGDIPPDTIVYAIGDIHGRLDLLEVCLEHLTEAARSEAGARLRIAAVFLGDYIDRGPDSRGVIRRLLAFRDEGVCETRFLRGNHEQLFLDVADGQDDGSRWVRHGGAETMASYCGAPPTRRDIRAEGVLMERLRASVPSDHLAFVRSTEMVADYGDYVFVHAGLRPDRLLQEQSPVDMLWLRYDDEPTVHGRIVVHGHVVNPLPVLGRHRIGIDTQAHASGALTMLRLQGDTRTFLKVSRCEPEGPGRIAVWDALDDAYRNDSQGPVRGGSEAPIIKGSNGSAAPFANVLRWIGVGQN